MADKQPNRPNNNAEALESWESEGGAPESDDRSTKKKRARDLNQWAKRTVDIAISLRERLRIESRRPRNRGAARVSAKAGADC